MKDVLEIMGLGSPFIFTAGTYWFFTWLDRNASAQATRALSDWLKGQRYRHLDLKWAIISMFDRLYSVPLLRVKAFIRSIIISSVVLIIQNWLIVFLYGFPDGSITSAVLPTKVDMEFYVCMVVADYLSLLVVRKLLFVAGGRPFLAMLCAIMAGGGVIIVVFITILVIFGSYFHFYIWKMLMFWYDQFGISGLVILILPAFVVHLWLPLFMVGALGVRGVHLFFFAVKWAQWFLKAGNQHPIRAIGTVAAVLVFAGTSMAGIVARI